ncbi:MAG TPA: IS1380 family transposase, partial [Nakamurella sp.]|nr:IS1380 family transposase [Nakamurella sp.]
MQVSHKVSVVFDEANLVSSAGLVPALELARRAGLHDLLTGRVSVPGPAGANVAVKVTSVVAAMLVGADCIEDTGVLRHGGMGRVLGDGRAATTLGTHLRAYRFGHVRQLDAVA